MAIESLNEYVAPLATLIVVVNFCEDLQEFVVPEKIEILIFQFISLI